MFEPADLPFVQLLVGDRQFEAADAAIQSGAALPDFYGTFHRGQTAADLDRREGARSGLATAEGDAGDPDQCAPGGAVGVGGEPRENRAELLPDAAVHGQPRGTELSQRNSRWCRSRS